MAMNSTVRFWGLFLALSLAVNVPLTWAITNGRIAIVPAFAISAVAGACAYALLDAMRQRALRTLVVAAEDGVLRQVEPTYFARRS